MMANFPVIFAALVTPALFIRFDPMLYSGEARPPDLRLEADAPKMFPFKGPGALHTSVSQKHDPTSTVFKHGLGFHEDISEVHQPRLVNHKKTSKVANPSGARVPQEMASSVSNFTNSPSSTHSQQTLQKLLNSRRTHHRGRTEKVKKPSYTFYFLKARQENSHLPIPKSRLKVGANVDNIQQNSPHRPKWPSSPLTSRHKRDTNTYKRQPLPLPSRIQRRPTIYASVSYKNSKVFHPSKHDKAYPAYPVNEPTLLTLDRHETNRQRSQEDDSVGQLLDNILGTERKAFAILNGNI